MVASAERRAGVVGIRFIDANDIDVNDKEGTCERNGLARILFRPYRHAFGRTVIAREAWQSGQDNRVSLGSEIATSLRSSR